MRLGLPELGILLLIALLLFSPRKLPELAKGLGQAIREFRSGVKASKGDDDESRDEPKPQ